MRGFDPELERRLRAFEDARADDVGFTLWDWLALITLGIIFPAGLLILGWPW